MTFHQAQEIALKFGAKQYLGDARNEAAQCWIDRIAYLPVAAEHHHHTLADAIAEANRYS